MSTVHPPRRPVTSLPPPPPSRAGATSGQRDQLPATPHAGAPDGVLGLVLPSTSHLPSALDFDPAVLAPAVPRSATPAGPAAPPRKRASLIDEATDRRIERLRVLALAGSLTALAALSAGALRLAL